MKDSRRQVDRKGAKRTAKTQSARHRARARARDLISRAFACSRHPRGGFLCKRCRRILDCVATSVPDAFHWSTERAIMAIIAQIRGQCNLKFSTPLPIDPINLAAVTSRSYRDTLFQQS